MKTNLDNLEANADRLGVMLALKAILSDARQALGELSAWEKYAHILAPRPVYPPHWADARRRLGNTAGAYFCGKVCRQARRRLAKALLGARGLRVLALVHISRRGLDFPAYSVGEAAAPLPLFAMATAFWLARDTGYHDAGFTAIGLVVMCGILTAEILIEGQKSGSSRGPTATWCGVTSPRWGFRPSRSWWRWRSP